MEIETTAVITTRTRRTIYNTVSMTIFYGRSTSFIVSAPIQTIRKRRKSPRRLTCASSNHGQLFLLTFTRLKLSTSVSRPPRKKRRERRRNTERNEQLQLKPVPKIKDHIFHQIFKPSWDVTNEAQFVWLFWNYTLVFRMQARTHQTAAPFLGFKFRPLLLSILPEVLSNHSNMIWN